MDLNPYEASRESNRRTKAGGPWFRSRKKPLWGYPLAAVLGGIVFTALIGWMLADLDDAGGLQFLIGAILGLVVYVLLF